MAISRRKFLALGAVGAAALVAAEPAVKRGLKLLERLQEIPVEEGFDARKYLKPSLLKRQADEALRSISASDAGVAARLKVDLKSLGGRERVGFRFLLAHLPAEQVVRNAGEMKKYVERMYGLRRDRLPWMPKRVKEDVWLENVLMPKLFGEDADLKGHLELQDSMLQFVRNPAKVRKAYEDAFGKGWVNGVLADAEKGRESLLVRALKNGITDKETALQVADHAKFLFMARPEHYSPTQPPAKGDMSITEMREAALQGVRFRGTNWTVYDARAAAVMGIAASPHVWGQNLVDRAPFATVVDLESGRHSLVPFFGEAGNPAENSLRTTTVTRIHPLSAAVARGSPAAATGAGNLSENVTLEFAQRHLPGVKYSNFSATIKDSRGKPADGVLRVFVIPREPDPNSPDPEKRVEVTVPAATMPVRRGKAAFTLALGNPDAASADPLNQRVLSDIRRGVSYVFSFERGGRTYSLKPDTTGSRLVWRPDTVASERLQPYELFEPGRGLKPLVLNPSTHHRGAIRIEARLP